MSRALLPALLVLLALAACPSAPAGRCNSDADCALALRERCALGFCSGRDELGLDAGAPPDDAGSLDAGPLDAGPLDAGPLDAGPLDAGPLDAGFDDAGEGDAGPSDAGLVDAGCPAGTHEGGAGCTPLDACSPGFAFFYVDDDDDGVGAGAPACRALPAAPGFSETGTDCDDGDGSVFALFDGFGDDDLDTFTSEPRTDCVGDAPPPELRALEQLAPVLLFEADNVESTGGSGQNAWTNIGAAVRCCGAGARADLDAALATSELRYSGFACSAAPARIDLVRVHVRGALTTGADQVLGLSATLRVDGVAGTTRAAMSTWSVNDRDFIIEGTPAEWGLAPVPADACDGSLGVSVVVEPNGVYNNEVEVDFVTLEIEGVPDCAPLDAAAYASVSVYSDADDDTHVGTLASTCNGPAPLLEPRDVAARDCDDSDGDAFPGQTNSFANERNGGGYDYNCDGAETKVNVTDVTACDLDVDAGVCNETTRTVTGACGAQVDDDTCNASCAEVQGTSPIRCR